MKKTMLALMAAAGAVGCGTDCRTTCCCTGYKPVEEVKFITVDPGHFHAALVQNRSYTGVSKDVRVFAPAGKDLESHLTLIKNFNEREKNPTAWKEDVYAAADFREKWLANPAGAGDVVILAGKNNLKADYYLEAVKHGFNVLSDKPMAITPCAYDKLEAAVKLAREKKLYFADIMTERREITTTLQKALANAPEIYGEQDKGTPEDPAVTKVSVHHFCKLVNGKPLQRPGWYYDTDQQGEAIVDVTTHLTDLVQWEIFPNETLTKDDVRMISARSWTTPITAADYETSTGLKTWPEFLKKDVDDQNVLQCKANGEFTYALKGVHAKVSVEWHFMPPKGTGDTHYSRMRGTKASVEIRQGAAQKYKPQLYVVPRAGVDAEVFGKTLEKIVARLAKQYPGIACRKLLAPGKNEWRIVIPESYNTGHESHFSQVMQTYLNWMHTGKVPANYLDNLLVKYYTLAQAWKMSRTTGASNAKDKKFWISKFADGTQTKVNQDEGAVAPYTLEDPLTFVNGQKVTNAADWAKRRAEILDIFAREMYGKRPPLPEALVTELVDEKLTCDGHAIRRQYDMWFKKDKTGPKLRWICFLPAEAKGKCPVILFLNYRGNHELVPDEDIEVMKGWSRNGTFVKDHRVIVGNRGVLQNPNSASVLPLGTILARGYAVMSACYCEVSPDPNREGNEDARVMQDKLAYTGVFDLWPKRDPKGQSEYTSLGAWSWALSRGLDLAERIPEIDATKSVVTGCSRLGKAALLAGAYDERFAVTVPNQTGGGGAPLAKRDFGENIATETHMFTHWYCRAYDKYAANPAKTLTFDQHLLLAAVAPRRLLIEGFNSAWFDTKGEYLACRAAGPVWEMLGKKGFPNKAFPMNYEQDCIGDYIGYVHRDCNHGISAHDWMWTLDFADKAFKVE